MAGGGKGAGVKRRRKGQGDLGKGGRWSIRGEVRWGHSLLTKEECREEEPSQG